MSKNPKYSEMDLLVRMSEIISAIQYCQNKYIYGVSLEPSHIFVTKQGNLKLAGFHSILNPKFTTTVWTIEEALIPKGVKLDNYNLAKIFFMLATNTTIFPEDYINHLQGLPKSWGNLIQNGINNAKNMSIRSFRGNILYI